MKICIWGAGKRGKMLGEHILQNQDELIGYIDNNKSIQAEGIEIFNKIKGEKQRYDVYSLPEIKNKKFDKIIISNSRNGEITAIMKQLKEESISVEVECLNDEKNLLKQLLSDVIDYDEYTDKRVSFLRDLARYIEEQDIKGCVAEAGVYMGAFAYYINKYFTNRKLYLFDTFEGFDEKDLKIEYAIDEGGFRKGQFSKDDYQFRTDLDLIEIIKKKLFYPEKVVFKKGYFPESAKDVDDLFSFVNLDMDLYNPIYAGLEFFYDKMSTGGVILIHDYYADSLPGVKKAVYDFENQKNIKLTKIPIGDGCSIAIIKS